MKRPKNFFSFPRDFFYHRNLNSISSHNCTKMLLLKYYITVYKYDIICLPEKCLDSSTRSDDHNLEIRRRVWIYYKNCLPLKVLNMVFLNECINFILRDWGKDMELCSSLHVTKSVSRRFWKLLLKFWIKLRQPCAKYYLTFGCYRWL